MKTIEVTDEMYNKLMELSTNINEQDHRCTAMPYFFQIRTMEKIAVPEGCGTEAWASDGSICEGDSEINEAISEYFELPIETVKDYTYYKKEELMEEAGWRKINYDYEERYQNAFLTEKSCKEHIRLNAYHYNDPVDYLSHAFRNPDMELVLQFLCGLTGKDIHR